MRIIPYVLSAGANTTKLGLISIDEFAEFSFYVSEINNAIA